MVKTIIRILPAIFAGAVLFAQTTTGRISGTVSDSSGAVIPGTSITVLNEGTGQTWKVQSNDRGFYVVPMLPVGAYSVEAELAGFQKIRKTGFQLDADSRLTADFTLSPGLTAILGRTAAYRGTSVTWDEIIKNAEKYEIRL